MQTNSVKSPETQSNSNPQNINSRGTQSTKQPHSATNESFQSRMAAKLKEAHDQSPQHRITAQLMGSPELEDEEKTVQGKFNRGGGATLGIGTSASSNDSGLPDHLKSGIENLSGIAMDDVKVHYNSDKPAQLQAHAYAQGTDIHLSPGQEKHLPHEAWHVVQQKQGRVKPTTQLKGVNINDNSSLEREADIMGSKALSTKSNESPIQKVGHEKGCNCPSCNVAQAKADGRVAQLGRNKMKGGLNELVKKSDSARAAYTISSGITTAEMALYGNTAMGSKVRLASSTGESMGSVNKSGIIGLKGVVPGKGRVEEANARWNDAEMNALAILDYDCYDIDPSGYDSFDLHVRTSIKMCKYCRRRINYWKNQLKRDWGKEINVHISV